jgi:hypothetical protein
LLGHALKETASNLGPIVQHQRQSLRGLEVLQNYGRLFPHEKLEVRCGVQVVMLHILHWVLEPTTGSENQQQLLGSVAELDLEVLTDSVLTILPNALSLCRKAAF